MSAKAEEKHFKNKNHVLIAAKGCHKSGSGKKIGAPAKATKAN